jgi:hypothetical protein
MRITMCTVKVAAVAVVAALSVRPAHAQGQMGGSITIWADANYRGQSTTLRGPVPDLRGYGFNNSISSMRIAQGQSWEACELPNFGGRCQVFSGDVRDLGGTAWNDKISSLRPVKRNVSGGNIVGPRPPMGGAQMQVILYSQPGFRGQSRVVSGPVADIRQANFNDRAQSARVVGNWQFCTDVNFGKCRQISSDFPNLSQAGLGGNLSSLRPVGGPSYPGGPGGPGYVPPTAAVIRLTMCAQPNFSGQGFPITGAMAQTGTVTTLSAMVQGRWQICDGRQFTGRCQVVNGNVADVRRLGLSRIQSARPQ